MKISFIIQDLFQQGAQYVTAMMLRGFVDKGYDVDLLVSKVHINLLQNGDIKPFDIPKETHLKVLPDEKARNNIMAIRKYILETVPDAIVAMSSNYTLALALASICLPRRIKKKCIFAYVEHSSFAGFDLKTMQPTQPRRFTPRWFYSLFIKKSYHVIMGVSEGTSKNIENYMRCQPGRVFTVYNPVIDAQYWEKLKEAPSHPWIIEKDIPTMVAAGAHCLFKNHMCLFEAIRIANEKVPVRLVLFGKGQLTEIYSKWIKDNKMSERISLAGYTTNLPAEIHNSDGFIISSNQESFSVVLVEALASGVPVISTNCPYGPPEILRNGKYGTLVQVNNSNAMAAAIIDHIMNPKQGAPKESWEPYTLDKIVDSYEKALGISNC